ncbi:TetR/AcrR family transcriptional regulator [Shimia biformata]|uniref:TetR/AcrR family transcriptional regulator n=1 Tax=Shimia biformata TaxID=1294299 RepID=UPI001950D611|nr:TetR/AcrR family transcriptional regulator [Shimia biformata]
MGTDSPDTGLRGRKKARRRQEILSNASELFARQGVDATTMAEIAEASEVSPPTVFNYFGSKENILNALIFEGAERARNAHRDSPRATGKPFGDILAQLLFEFTDNTLQIAGKRVWRYAESVNIRRPNSDFQKRFATSDAALIDLLAEYLGDYDMRLLNGADPDPDFLARMFFDRWTARYFAFIKDEVMSLEAHRVDVVADTHTMVGLLFEPEFAAHSPLKKKAARS